MCLGFKAVILKNNIIGRNYYINWQLNLNWSCFRSSHKTKLNIKNCVLVSAPSKWDIDQEGLCPVSDEITLALNLHTPWLEPFCHSVILWNFSIHWWRLTGFYILGQPLLKIAEVNFVTVRVLLQHCQIIIKNLFDTFLSGEDWKLMVNTF